jgi:hypothetical protein
MAFTISLTCKPEPMPVNVKSGIMPPYKIQPMFLKIYCNGFARVTYKKQKVTAYRIITIIAFIEKPAITQTTL